MPRTAKWDDNPFETGLHAEDVKERAKESIKEFFHDKVDFNGERISEIEMLSSFCVKTVLRSRFNERTFLFIHNECLIHIEENPEWVDDLLSWETKYLLELLESLQSLGLPKDFFPGLVLLYFKFCYGVEILDPPPLL